MPGICRAQKQDTVSVAEQPIAKPVGTHADTTALSPGILLGSIRQTMAQAVREGRYLAVDSLVQVNLPRFTPGQKPLFLEARERILLDFLQKKAQAWADLTFLNHALNELWLGYIADQTEGENAFGHETLMECLVKAVRKNLSDAEDGLYQGGLHREEQDFLLLVLHSMILDYSTNASNKTYGPEKLIYESEKFFKTYPMSVYTGFVRRHCPHELTPTLGGFGMGFGYGGISLESPATEHLGDPRIFAWDLTWYEGLFALTAQAHFAWGLKAKETIVYHGQWKSGWHLSAVDMGLNLGYRLFPLSPFSLEPHVGLHWFELEHSDGSDDKGNGPDERRMLGETEYMSGLSIDWNWVRSKRLGNRYNPSVWYLRCTLDWLHAPLGSHRPELAGNGLAFYVSLGGLLKGMR